MRKLLRVTGLCFLLGLAACSHDKRVPSDILAPERMGAILLDMRIASSYNDTYVPARGEKELDRENRLKTLYAQVLDLHRTDVDQFIRAYHFYEDHPDLMQKIYQMMQDSIDRKSAYEEAKAEEESRIRRARLMASRPVKLKDYLMLYQTAADSFPPRRIRCSRPLVHPPAPPPEAPPDFLLLYKSIADSVHYEPRRIFNPHLFD